MKNEKKPLNVDRLFEILYSAGAVPVLLGALFKLTHVNFIFSANTWLTVGLVTEVLVFGMTAIRYWLFNDITTPGYEEAKIGNVESLQLSENNIHLLNTAIDRLHNNVRQINNISSASINTDEFIKSIQTANATVKSLDEYYTQISSAATELSKASENSKRINEEMESLITNINQTNKGYEAIANVFKK